MFSCSKESGPNQVTFTTNSDQWNDLIVNHIPSGVFLQLKDDAVKVDVENEETLFEILADRSLHYVLARPGDSFSIDSVKGGGIVVRQSGDQSSENKFLEEYEEIISDLQSNQSPFTFADKDESAFKAAVGEKFQVLSDKAASLNKNEDISTSFKGLIKKRMMSEKAIDLLMYEQAYEYMTKEKPEVSEEYYSFLDDLDVQDSDMILFESTRNFADRLRSKDVNFNDHESVDDYFDALSANGAKLFGESSLIATYSRLTDLEAKVNFGSGIDGAGDAIEAFQSSVNNPYFNSRLEKTIGPWKELMRGKEAPDFDGLTRDGKKVHLDDLKGKKVYVDVWATWCGPCIREIPSLKELEEELHGEAVEFVSVSIDQESDREKWRKFVEDRNLGGTQIMTEGAWESDLTKNYNIKGIPRFILIDEQSRIISANAPRPSEERTKDYIMEEAI